MRSAGINQAIIGSLAAMGSVLLIFGSLYLSASEQLTTQANVTFKPPATPTTIPSPLPLMRDGNQSNFILPTLAPPFNFTPTTIKPAASSTPPPIPSNCPPPANWAALTIQTGDTLDSLAQSYGISAAILTRANCLIAPNLVTGSIIYVPLQPTTEPTAHCGPPPGWVFYTVHVYDTLTYIGQLYGVSVSELQFANCMESETIIRVGQQVYVPNAPTLSVPPHSPYSTSPPYLTATSAATLINTTTAPIETPLIINTTPPPQNTSTPIPPPPSATIAPPTTSPATDIPPTNQTPSNSGGF